MRKAGLPEDMNAWKLHRLDLCVNICWSRKGAAAELIRLMRVEDLTLSGFEKSTTGQRHEVRYSKGQLELVAYAFCKRFPDELTTEIFEHILNKALNNRMLDPSAVFIDGTHIKASANKKKFQKEQVVDCKINQ